MKHLAELAARRLGAGPPEKETATRPGRGEAAGNVEPLQSPTMDTDETVAVAQEERKFTGQLIETSLAPKTNARDFVTVLTARKRLSKTWISPTEVSTLSKALWVKAEVHPVDSIYDLTTLLQGLEKDPFKCVIRGRLRADAEEVMARNLPEWNAKRKAAKLAEAQKAAKEEGREAPQEIEYEPLEESRPGPGFVLRRKALFEDAPHHWVLLDVDGVETPTPPGRDARQAVEEFISLMPAEFQCASFHVQLSNSAGLPKNEKTLKAHVWFWLEKAHDAARLNAWAQQLNADYGQSLGDPEAKLVDATVMDTIQLHYTSAPGFEKGVADPLAIRSWFDSRGAAFGSEEVSLVVSDRVVAAQRAKAMIVDDGRVDPRQKPGVIGAFHRAFEVEDVIARFLSEQFEHASGDRYTWLGGGGAAEGAFVRADRCGLGASHNSWPWGPNSAPNSFDLVRHFNFGHRDDEIDQLLPPQERPSHKAMCAWAASLDEVQRELASSKAARLDEMRRQAQIEENKRIGEGTNAVPVAELVTLKQALDRFVFISDGSRVADLAAPHYDLALSDWRNKLAASNETLPKLKDGKSVKDEEENELTVSVPVSKLWLADPRRQGVECRTFKAGAPLVVKSPENKEALNTWRPYDRTFEPSEADMTKSDLFFNHVTWLWGDDAPRFLDWLAHIEQHPGVLPHVGWLHVARSYGTGRNWISSVLVRLWPGKVAVNVDLPEMLAKGYTGTLAGKILATVDEIREGARDSQWQHAEALKSMMTCETRLINPKYGRQSVEFNACRWLMFSNHDSAIPLDKNDRRVEVARCEAAPRSPEYYTELYRALSSRGFIAAVAARLAARDISRFNPGAKATLNSAKLDVVQASQTPTGRQAELLVEKWPADVIRSSDLAEFMCGPGGGAMSAAHRRALNDFGAKARETTVKVEKVVTRIWALRNVEHWLTAPGKDVERELERVQAARHEIKNLDAEVQAVVDGWSAGELLDYLSCK